MSTTSVRTPFLDADSFAREEMESVPPVRAASGPWSPFLSVYEADEGENQADQPLREAYATLVNDLYDEEFDEALFELLTSAQIHSRGPPHGRSLPRRGRSHRHAALLGAGARVRKRARQDDARVWRS